MRGFGGRRVFVATAVATVLGAVVAGLLVIGSPAAERARRLDAQRVGDLRELGRSVDVYWTRHGRLPSSLDELSDEAGLDGDARDPGTGLRYEYRVIDDATYELCASFERRGEQPEPAGFWSHGAGRQCFRVQARVVDR
jgi:hypothetical protein